jgi:Tfp pilus assembly protein PilO
MKINRDTARLWSALIGLIVLFAAAVLLPFGIRDARLQTRIDAARDDLGIADVDNAGLVRLHGEVQDLRAQVAGRGQSIPDEQEISLVLKDLSQLINAPGVSGQEIVTDKAKYFADYNILPVKIQFNAPFATAFDLVKRIETLSRVVRIDQLNVEAEPDYPRQPLTINLELSAFFASQDNGGER